MARAEADDAIDGKIVSGYKPAIGAQDGQNTIFQIPVQRVVVQYLQIYKNNDLLVSPTDYTMLNAKLGQFQYAVAPEPNDAFLFNIAFTWADDIEFDHYLNRAANEMGFQTYHTDVPGTVAGSEVQLDSNGNPLPSIGDFPQGLISALIYGGASKVASALASRFAMKYDISAGDKSYSPSQMATAYEKKAETLQKQFLTARDDFYKGQGTQYRPSIAMQTGYLLPNWTPKR
jgi:hypothetical protein